MYFYGKRKWWLINKLEESLITIHLKEYLTLQSSNIEKISAQYNEGILLVNIPGRGSQFLLEN